MSKISIKSLFAVVLCVIMLFPGCSKPKETVKQDEVVFESESNDISISLTGYEYAPESEPCFVIRFKAVKNNDRKLICTAYDVKIDGVLAEENALYNLAEFEDSNEAEGSIVFGAQEKYDIDFANAKEIQFEYNIRDKDDASYTFNGTASFALKDR